MRRAEQFAEDIKFAVTLDEVIGLRDDLEALRALAGLAKSKRTSDLPKEMEESFMDDSTKRELDKIWTEVFTAKMQIENYIEETEKAQCRIQTISNRLSKTTHALRTLYSRAVGQTKTKPTRPPSKRARKVSARR